ncbi:hypothetical protein ACI792_09615 [Blastococcus sp. SYSU DS0669]
MLHRMGVPLLVVVAVVLGTAAPAPATWATRAAAGPAVVAAAVMPPGEQPTASGSGVLTRSFTVTWRTSHVAGVPVTGYVVRRTSSLLGAGLVSEGTCSGVSLLGIDAPVYVPADPAAETQSCTDTSLVSLGTVSYTVTPVLERWLGTPSPWSAPVS